MVMARVDVGEDPVLVLQPAVVSDRRVLHRRERPASTSCGRGCVDGTNVGGGEGFTSVTGVGVT
jgi:hypothetical protein